MAQIIPRVLRSGEYSSWTSKSSVFSFSVVFLVSSGVLNNCFLNMILRNLFLQVNMYRKFSISRKGGLQHLINGEKRQTFLERKLYFSFVINLMVNSQEIIENYFLYFYWGLIVFSIPLFVLNTGIKWYNFSKDPFFTLWISANWNILYNAVHSCGKESKSHKNNKRNLVLFRQARVSQGQFVSFKALKDFFPII